MPTLREPRSPALPCTGPLPGVPVSGVRWLLHVADRYRFRNDPSASSHPGAAAVGDCQGRADGPPRPRAGPVAPTAPYPPTAPPDPAECHSTHRYDGGHRLRGRCIVPERRGKNARPIATLTTRHADGPISAKAPAPSPTIAPPSLASSRARQASSAGGWVTTRTDGRARRSSPKPFRLTGRRCTRTHGRATEGVTQPMPQSATGFATGRAIMLGRVDATCIATPVREQARHFGPTCGPSAGSTSRPGICRWRRLRRWAMRSAAHPR